MMMRKLAAAATAAVMAMTMTGYTAFAQNEPENTPEATAVTEETASDYGDPEDTIEQTLSETKDVDQEGEPEDPEQPTLEDPEKPESDAPVISVKAKEPALSVSWNEVENAAYYEVYRSYSANSRGALLGKVKDTLSYNDKNVYSGKKAYYQVRAQRKDGSFTEYSDVVWNRIYRVYIETGHGINRNGIWDPGCTWGKYQEAKLMLPICKSMAKYLRERGVYVYTDADNGNNRNLKWLLKNLEGYKVSVLVNVHCDNKGTPRGTLPLYRTAKQKELAECLNKGMHKHVKIKNRGLKKRKNLETLNKTRSYCVACLFETGNIKKDNKILRKKYDAYGKGLAEGVCSYLGVKW